MKPYLYLSLLPESLVASMLPPEEFGAYLATGTVKQPHGQAMFFSLNRDFQSDYFKLANLEDRCAPHADGQPKHSLYLAIYRVLEHIPLEAMESLWLTTAHGRTLELKQASLPAAGGGPYHLYREICPVQPTIASTLGPVDFCKLVTDPSKAIYVPRICVVDLTLGGLAVNPQHGDASNLPYPDIDHIRHCLAELKTKQTKTVDRISEQSLLYRCVKSGFFVGDSNRVIHYPYPTHDELEGKYHIWWRGANGSELTSSL